MEKGFPPLLCQSHQYHPLVLRAAVTLQVAFFLQTVHIRSQGSHGDVEFSGDPGHTLWFLDTDSLQNVYVIICNILEFLGDDRLFFQFLYLVKQMDQCLIDDFSVIHSSSPFRLFCPFRTGFRSFCLYCIKKVPDKQYQKLPGKRRIAPCRFPGSSVMFDSITSALFSLTVQSRS